MSIRPITGKIESQPLNDNFSYLDSKPIDERNIPNSSIPATKLKTASDDEKIKLANLSQEVVQAIAGTAPVNAVPGDQTVTSTKYATESASTRAFADKVVTVDKLDFDAVGTDQINVPVVYQKPGKNLIDQSKLTDGYFVGFNTGNLGTNASYSVSHFIRVTPNQYYVYNDDQQIAFYDKNKVYVSGIARNNASPAPFVSFQVPATARFMRINVPISSKNTFQLERGTKPTRYEAKQKAIEVSELNTETKMHDLLMHLQNPFIPTKVKLIGSSTIAGNGGTGYSTTGELIMVDSNGVSRYANVESAYCWANEFKKNVEQSYNKEFYIDSDHPSIKVYGYDGSYGSSSGSLTGLRWSFGNTIDDYTLMEFDFYGDTAKVLYFKSGFSGVFSVYIDDVLHGTIDTYNAAQQNNVEYVISGLSVSYHNLKIVGRNTRNVNSTQNNIFIQGIKVKKYATVKNWGVSGSNSEFLKNNVDVWVQNDDDFVFIQTGSNDREKQPDDFTRALLIFAIKKIKARGKACYILSFAPPSQTNENNSLHKMDAIERRLREVAVLTQSPFIDIYNEFLDYMHWTGTPFEELTADGLHVNDKGYGIMLRKVAKETGITINRGAL